MVEIDVQQDANAEESSAPQTEQSTEQTETKPAPDQQQAAQEQMDRFDKHPRFQELISENRAAKQQLQEMQRVLQELQSARQAAPAPAAKAPHALVAKMGEIDGSYAEYFKDLEAKANSVAELKAELAEIKRERFVSDYNSRMDKLHSEMKTPDNLRALIKERIEAKAAQDPRLGMNDLPNIYKQAHEETMKLFEEVKRAERASYVQAKGKDSQTPTASKGKSGVIKSKPELPTDREELKALIVQRALKQNRADQDI